MQQIIVNDGFYGDAQQMKTLFSSLDYEKNENFIGGLICPMNFANDDMLKQMEHILNVPEGYLEFVEGSGSFIINTKDDIPKQTVGVNFPDINTVWIGIVCLSEVDEPHYLKFYKHKRTGWEKVPPKEELFGEGITSYNDFQNFIAGENVDVENKWQETSRIKFGTNQLILFRPDLFHSYSDVYGDTKETGRLLQFFFLRPKAAAI